MIDLVEEFERHLAALPAGVRPVVVTVRVGQEDRLPAQIARLDALAEDAGRAALILYEGDAERLRPALRGRSNIALGGFPGRIGDLRSMLLAGGLAVPDSIAFVSELLG